MTIHKSTIEQWRRDDMWRRHIASTDNAWSYGQYCRHGDGVWRDTMATISSAYGDDIADDIADDLIMDHDGLSVAMAAVAMDID